MRRHFPFLTCLDDLDRDNPAKNVLRFTNGSDKYKKKFRRKHLSQNLAAALLTSFEISLTACSPRADSRGMRETSPGSPLHRVCSPSFPPPSVHTCWLCKGRKRHLPQTTASTRAVTRKRDKSCPQHTATKREK